MESLLQLFRSISDMMRGASEQAVRVKVGPGPPATGAGDAGTRRRDAMPSWGGRSGRGSCCGRPGLSGGVTSWASPASSLACPGECPELPGSPHPLLLCTCSCPGPSGGRRLPVHGVPCPLGSACVELPAADRAAPGGAARHRVLRVPRAASLRRWLCGWWLCGWPLPWKEQRLPDH